MIDFEQIKEAKKILKNKMRNNLNILIEGCETEQEKKKLLMLYRDVCIEMLEAIR